MFAYSCVFFANVGIGSLITSQKLSVREKCEEAARAQRKPVELYIKATTEKERRHSWKQFLG